MATGTTGAPGNISYPVGSDQYALTSDLSAMASQTNLALVNAVADAVGQAQWSRGVLPAGANLATIQAGAYSVPNYTAAQGISPALPVEALGAGSLVIHPGTTYRTIEFVPIGVAIRPKPIWRNEFNENLSPQWYGWHRVDAGALLPAPLDTTLITVLGDSQSADSVAGNWPSVADPLLTQAFYNQARSGDDSNAVGIRAGWVRPLVSVVGGVIPASGSVTVTTAEQLQLRDNRVLVTGTIAGVAGSLTHVSGGSFTFTRDGTGSAVAVPGPVRFESAFTTAASVIIVWMGGNDFSQGSTGTSASIADHIVGNYRAAVEWGGVKGQTVLVAGVTNRRDGDDASFQQVLDVNSRLRELYPDRFLNVQGYLSQRALTDAGITPTQADRDAMARGMIPPSLFLADGVHLTTAAYQVLGAERIAPWLVASGYANAETTMPAPAPLAPGPDPVADASRVLDLTTEHLDTLLEPCEFRQSTDANASVANGYPDVRPSSPGSGWAGVGSVKRWGTAGQIIQNYQPRIGPAWVRERYTSWGPWRLVTPAPAPTDWDAAIAALNAAAA